MKRSRSIRLVLIGGLSAGALTTSCGPESARVSADNVYTNNYYVPGIGYYHAPFRAWYAFPYNHRDPRTGRYFYGGQWGESPFQNITNISAPMPAAAQQAQARRTDVPRGGFGRTSHYWGGSGISS
ncbi:MAG: hypothetical protein MUF81_14580 [Verrucomicrobia bacterium]|nr:hypothetical protein [Verrucomicrobiota bacterium]